MGVPFFLSRPNQAEEIVSTRTGTPWGYMLRVQTGENICRCAPVAQRQDFGQRGLEQYRTELVGRQVLRWFLSGLG